MSPFFSSGLQPISLFLSGFSFCLLALFSCTGQHQPTSAPESEFAVLTFPERDSVLRFKGHIRCLYEDRKGHFWIGSHQEGLAHFDGRDYAYYTTEHGLPDMQVRSFQEDAEGYIWIHTQTGIARFSGSHFAEVLPQPGSQLITDYPWSREKPIADYLFFDVGNRNGVYVLDEGKLHHLRYPVPEDYPTFDTNGYNPKYGYDLYATYGFHKDQQGNLYLGTVGAGLFRFDGHELKNLSLGDSIGVVRSIFRDRDGTVWFGNNGIGLSKYENEQLIDFSEERDLKVHGIQGAFGIEQDEEGNIWFGTYTTGLWCYAPAQDLRPDVPLLPGSTALRQITEINGTNMMEMAGIYKDRSGRLYIYNRQGQIFVFENGNFIEFGMPR